jgi:hypothetical protein
MKVLVPGVLLWIGSFTVFAQTPSLRFEEKPASKELALYWGDTLLTRYCFYDSVMKPVLFPVNTPSGITVTRGYPLDPRPGERVDHPHHIGLWLNYQYVNGFDFWNNSTAIAPDKRRSYGTVVHDRIVRKEAKDNTAFVETSAQWKRPDKLTLLIETTRYNFTVDGSTFIIDRITTLRALSEDADMRDIKDGLLGLRVTRELELPSNESVNYVDGNGNITEVPAINNEGVTGNYLSSEGLTGEKVWGTRGTWVSLSGKKNNKDISVTILDHPGNPGFPTYWHARGYGLFAANPIAPSSFDKKQKPMNLVIRKGEAVTFRFRVVVHEGEVTRQHIESWANAFNRLN